MAFRGTTNHAYRADIPRCVQALAYARPNYCSDEVATCATNHSQATHNTPDVAQTFAISLPDNYYHGKHSKEARSIGSCGYRNVGRSSLPPTLVRSPSMTVDWLARAAPSTTVQQQFIATHSGSSPTSHLDANDRRVDTQESRVCTVVYQARAALELVDTRLACISFRPHSVP